MGVEKANIDFECKLATNILKRLANQEFQREIVNFNIMVELLGTISSNLHIFNKSYTLTAMCILL